MSTGILTLRKHWLAATVAAILLAAVLTAGTLFAASERQQPEAQPQPQPSVADAADFGRDANLPAAPPAPERVPVQSVDNDEEESDLPPVTKEPPKYPNLDSNLNGLVEEALTGVQRDAGQQPSTTDSSGGGAAPAGEPVLVTFYIEPEQVAAVRQYLEDNDVFVRNVGEDYIEAHVPPALLGAASELPGVGRVDTVIPPEPQSLGDVVSQGVALHQADAWHRQGYRGQGVKVGIIDSGFEGFSQLQGSELPRNVMARCYFDAEAARAPSSRLADCEVDGDHGTIVAETLMDVAPEVELYIANPKSGGDLETAVDWMVGNGVDVINRSIGNLYQGPGDGTSYFPNGIIRSINTGVDGGIVFVNSAGNSAREVWYGRFSDPDGNGSHNYTPRDVGNTFYLPFDEEDRRASRVTAFMRWDDAWGGADCNLDLYLNKSATDNSNAQRIVSDVDVQDGGDSDIPRAIVRFEAGSEDDEGLYYLAIRKEACATDPAWIQLTAWIAGNLEYYSEGHHIGNPAESKNTGMLAVGATHWWDTEYIADYSSRGPTIDGRIKPDITGVACGRTTKERSTPGSACWFAGTSQASPHVAGLAALVKQRFPDYTPEQVADYLKQNATERGSAGADNEWGHGFATLPGSRGAVSPGGGFSPTSNIDVRLGNNADEVIISWDSVPGASHYRIGYVNMEVDYNLAEASCTGEWIEAFVYVDVNARNIPVSNGRAEYTLRRLSPGARHAFTVLTSNNFVDSGGGGSVSSEFFWPSNPRWQFQPGRDTLPPGVVIPQLDCNR